MFVGVSELGSFGCSSPSLFDSDTQVFIYLFILFFWVCVFFFLLLLPLPFPQRVVCVPGRTEGPRRWSVRCV